MTHAGAQGLGDFYVGCLVLVDDPASAFNNVQAHVKTVHAIGPSDAKLSLQLRGNGPNFDKLYATVWTRRGLRLGYLPLCRCVIRLDRSQCTRVALTAGMAVRVVAHSHVNGPAHIVFVQESGYLYPPFRPSLPCLPARPGPLVPMHSARRSVGGPASRSVAVHRVLTGTVSRYSVGTTMQDGDRCDERVIWLGEKHLLLDRVQTEPPTSTPSTTVRHSLRRLPRIMYRCSISLVYRSVYISVDTYVYVYTQTCVRRCRMPG